MSTPPRGDASEKRPNSPVNILPAPTAEDFADLEPDPDLFGTDDLVGIEAEVAPNDEEAAQ